MLPFTIPLAWLIIILCGRYLVLRLQPAAARWQVALGVAAVASLTDLNLEFVAWKVRGYWIWYPGAPAPPAWPPLQNYASWFAAAFLLAWLLPPNYELRSHRPAASRPIAILALINGLFLLTQTLRWLGVIQAYKNS